MSHKTTQTRHKAAPAPARRFPIALALAGVGLVIIALAVLFSRQASPAAPEVTGRPNIQVDQTLIDHGEVKLGTPITDVVRVTNTGDQTLRFTEAPYIEVLEGC